MNRISSDLPECEELAIAHYFDLPVTAPFVSRTYLVHHRNKPLGKITEKWPLSYFTRAP